MHRITVIRYKGIEMFCISSLWLLLLYFLLVGLEVIKIQSWENLYFPVLLTMICTILVFFTDKYVLLGGPNFALYLYTVISLFGLILFLPLFPEVEDIRSSTTMAFLRYTQMNNAIVISCISVIVFTLSTSIFSRMGSERRIRSALIGNGIKDIGGKDDIQSYNISIFGLLLLISCLIYILIFVALRPSLLAGSYTLYNQVVRHDTVFSYATIGFGFAIIIIFTCGNRKQIYMGISLFSIITLIEFLMGNRGEVLYPWLVCFAVYIKRQGTFKRRTMLLGIIGIVFLLLMINVIRETRTGIGLNEALETGLILGIVEAFAEMGYQIGTIVYTLSYLQNGGEFMFGSTYIYSIQHYIAKFLPFIIKPIEDAPQRITTIMPLNYIGYTNVGEAYLNFGIFGCVIMMIALALLLIWLGRFKGTGRDVYREVFWNIVLFILISQVRNTSITVPIYLTWANYY